MPQSVLERCFEGGALVQLLFGEKTAPGASWCVLGRSLGGAEIGSFGSGTRFGGALARRRARGRADFGIFSNKLDR